MSDNLGDEREPVRWFSDDFETTTDLDSDPLPYILDEDEQESLATLAEGESRLTVAFSQVRGAIPGQAAHLAPDEKVAHTVTATRTNGALSATYRTGRVRVWSWAIAPLHEDRIYRGTTIASYVEKAAELGGIHWFHNLRFDGAFLDAYLIDNEPVGLGLKVIDAKPRSVPAGHLGSLIGDQGAHYARYVHLEDGRRFECRDSLKKFPNTSVADLAGMFGAELGKGEIDYTAERPQGYQPTPEEWDYIERDVDIVRTALRVPEEVGNTGLTIGGDAMTEYRATMAHGKFRTVFPLLDRQLDDWLRQAYRGGWTYINPKYQGQILELAENPGSVWDVNSMYPAVMRQSSFPVGIPVPLAPGQTSLRGYPHVVYGALLSAKIRPGHFPMIQVKRDARYNPVDYQSEVRGVEWYGTEVDWALLHEQYEVDVIEWIAGFAFRGISGLFNRYIDKWMAVKEAAGQVMEEEKAAGRRDSERYRQAAAQKAQAKFQLNNLWGRFGVNPLRAKRLPSIGLDGAPHYNLTPQTYDQPSYTPVGIWTTSYGRDRVIRAAQSFGGRFLAADTDSCHVLGTDPGILDVHPTRLGAWALEAEFDRATYLRAKAYAEQIVEKDGSREIEAHVAGLPRKLLQGARIEDIAVGTKYSGKLVPKRVPGGIILVSTDFEIGEKDAWGHRS